MPDSEWLKIHLRSVSLRRGARVVAWLNVGEGLVDVRGAVVDLGEAFRNLGEPGAVRAVLLLRTWQLRWWSVEAMLLAQPRCGPSTTQHILSTYLANVQPD